VTCYLKSCLLTGAYMDFHVYLLLSLRSPFRILNVLSGRVLISLCCRKICTIHTHSFKMSYGLHSINLLNQLCCIGLGANWERALETVMQHVHYEDENTQYICIASVNKVNWGLWLLVEPLQKKVESSFVLFLLRASEELCCITRQCSGVFFCPILTASIRGTLLHHKAMCWQL